MQILKVAALCYLSSALVTLAHDGKDHVHPAGEVSQELAQTGNGVFTYSANSKWGALPNEGEKLGPTHGSIVVDSAGHIYVATNGAQAVFVFKADGTHVRNFATEFKGIHHLAIMTEGEQEFIYGAQLSRQRIVKLGLDGKIALAIPNEKTGEIPGGFKGVTGVAVAPDGHIFASTGYGSNMIHKFDKEGKLLKSFGGRGPQKDKFTTPHTLAVDLRFGAPRLLVCDREKRRLVHFDLEGTFLGEHASNLRRPCAVSFFGEYCAVAELESRVTILDKTGTPVSFLGDNPNKAQWAKFGVAPADQKPGIFSAPHGLSFDKEGNLYVQDWNATGRVTRLQLKK